MSAFVHTGQTEEAAQLLAEGRLSNLQIAEKLGVAPRTLYTWRHTEAFQDRVTEILAEIRKEIERRGIARREMRLRRLNDHWVRLQTVIEERADDYVRFEEESRPSDSAPPARVVPGGKTGLLAQTEDGWELDTDLLKELRQMEKQAAIETGQWTEKREVSGKDGAPITVKILGPSVSMEDL